jgi:hypothetical protein
MGKKKIYTIHKKLKIKLLTNKKKLYIYIKNIYICIPKRIFFINIHKKIFRGQRKKIYIFKGAKKIKNKNS